MWLLFQFMKCLRCKHKATTSLSWSARYARRKCAHFAFHAVYRTSLAKRLHFSCTEGALNWKKHLHLQVLFPGSPCWTRTNDPAVNSGCDANIKQCHSIPCSVEPWFFPYNAINKRFAWCEKSLNNNGVRQLLDGLLAVVLYSGVEQLVAH